MSDSELEKIPLANWFDSKSDLPDISSISLSSNLSENVNQFSVNPQNSLALGFDDINFASSVLE